MMTTLAHRWCPIFFFDRQETFFPVNHTDLFQHLMVYRKNLKLTSDAIDIPVLQLCSLGWNETEGTLPPQTALFIEPAARYKVICGHSHLATTACYVHRKTVGDRVQLQYWFIYGMTEEPAGLLWSTRSKELDCMCVRMEWFASQLLTTHSPPPIRIWLQTHSIQQNRGYWITPDRIHFCPRTGRPELYIARHSHAVYPRTGLALRSRHGQIDVTSRGLRCDPVLLFSPSWLTSFLSITQSNQARSTRIVSLLRAPWMFSRAYLWAAWFFSSLCLSLLSYKILLALL